MIVSIEELSRREVINIETAARVGFVSDMDLNTETGEVTALLVRSPGGLFRSPPPVRVLFRDVIRIGEETVLVSKVSPAPPPPPRRSLLGLLGK